MRTNKKLYSVALASAALILFLIWISSTASVSISEPRITKHVATQILLATLVRRI